MKKTAIVILAAIIGQAMAQQPVYVETYTVGNQSIPAVRNQGQLSVIPPGTPIMPPNAAAARGRIHAKPLNFNNSGQAHISGAVRGLGMAAYHFIGQAGQSIRMVPNNKNFAMEFALFNPEMGMRFGSVHTLPYSGEYEVRIVQNHKNAAHSKKSRPYNVTVYLDGSAGNIMPSAGVPVQPSRAIPVVPQSAPQAMYSGNEPMPVKKSAPTMTAVPMAGAAAAVPVEKNKRSSKKGKSRNYQCQNGARLNVEYLNLNTPSPTAIVHSDVGEVSLPVDDAASGGKNLIFSSDEDMLHLVKTHGNNLAQAEVLSFDHNGVPVAFSCKPR
ncbi:MAG: hypothetical protein Q4A74_06150 [Cardiobacteriaceae bacterium]|nr:hypothetical protein [Cardiobacteriaceae bacterium]